MTKSPLPPHGPGDTGPSFSLKMKLRLPALKALPAPMQVRIPRALLRQGPASVSLLSPSSFSVTFPCSPPPPPHGRVRTEQIPRAEPSSRISYNNLQASRHYYYPIIQIWKLKFKEIKPRIPSSHLSICCSVCLEHSSPTPITMAPTFPLFGSQFKCHRGERVSP